jgi:hypothetical protein
MKWSYFLRVIPVALILYLNLVPATAATEIKDPRYPGYSVRLSEDSIDLIFPDGSVLSTAHDYDRLNLDGVKASGGMAEKLLFGAYEQLKLKPELWVKLPKVSSLAQNSPNPFNPSTTISYTVASAESLVPVRLEVFNIRGQLVRALVNEVVVPGEYSFFWQSLDDHGEELSSGIYFYRLRAGDFVATRKMVIVK